MKNENLFLKLKNGLMKTKNNFTSKIDQLINYSGVYDENFFEELEEILILSDIGMETTEIIIEKTKEKIKTNNIKNKQEVKKIIKEIIKQFLEDDMNSEFQFPIIILVVGVNGVGKTTTISKLAHKFKLEGKKVILAAGDTFRAAAVEQLSVWAERIGVEIIKNSQGADPASVIFDALQAAKSRNADVLICDTAGRLHNKSNLMKELSKINKIIDNEKDKFNTYNLLVIDATTGINGVNQAKIFNDATQIDGIALTKLDGTSKGGIIITIKSLMDIPVKYVGVGESLEDLQEFNSEDFTNILFE